MNADSDVKNDRIPDEKAGTGDGVVILGKASEATEGFWWGIQGDGAGGYKSS